jgi:hypothetical protein
LITGHSFSQIMDTSTHHPVDAPKHYTYGGLECMDVIKVVTKHLPGNEAFFVGQIIKYTWRYRLKHESPKNDVGKIVRMALELQKVVNELPELSEQK